MDYNIAVIDDDNSDIARLKTDIESYFRQSVREPVNISAFNDGRIFIDAFHPGMFHLVFMDICMDGISGIDTVKGIRKVDPDILVVFLTSSEEYAFDAFPLHCFDYILKPYSVERLFQVLKEFIRKISSKDPEICVRVPRAVHSVTLGSIVAVLSEGHSVEIRLKDGNPLKCLDTFTKISTQLMSDPRFLPCNKGIIINMDYVLTLDNDKICLEDGSYYPMKVRGRAEIIKTFTSYTIRRLKEE
ncbi:MAG: LytTR family DNA-binding domain-containing protein [Lachnospiraceae bacterium]|nr:LytTR family DNA-binding domain-containing protein [Lachnospiraceae bacterium]